LKPKEVRSIKREVERELWARAAGRCQFNGCNKPLYKSPITQERVNISEKAHIYSFSKDGPRGWWRFAKNNKSINDIENLILMCHDCHTTIDQDINGERYSAKFLQQWKKEHETRVRIVTGISSNMKSHVIFYSANIGDEKSPIQKNDAFEAMFPIKFPQDEHPIVLSMKCEHDDSNPDYWTTETNNLKNLFKIQLIPRIQDNDPAHFSIFALAPQPLLIQLGALFTDKVDVETYQLHREPNTWKWQNYPDGFKFITHKPQNFNNPPVLIVSLSDFVDYKRIYSVLGENVSIWELTTNEPHNDCIKSQAQLSMFRTEIRKLIIDIKQQHGNTTPLTIFPVMPISCAIELGRVRMPKADMSWVIYDQNHKKGKFIKALTISGDHNE